MRLVWDLVGVFMAAVIVFVSMVFRLFFGLIYFALSMACFLCLLVSGFSFVGFVFTHTTHTGLVAAVYLGYAAAVFGVLTVIIHLRGLASEGKQGRALERMSGLRLANPHHSL